MASSLGLARGLTPRGIARCCSLQRPHLALVSAFVWGLRVSGFWASWFFSAFSFMGCGFKRPPAQRSAPHPVPLVRRCPDPTSRKFFKIVQTCQKNAQGPKKHPNINYWVGYPYVIGLLQEGILGYPTLWYLFKCFLVPRGAKRQPGPARGFGDAHCRWAATVQCSDEMGPKLAYIVLARSSCCRFTL